MIPLEPGSNDLSAVPEAFALEPTAVPRYIAMAGFVDPDTDLVEVLDSSSRVVDSAKPTNGAFIVAMALWGQIRWYEDDEVVGAFPIVSDLARAETQKVDSRARSVADEFVYAILSGQWSIAARYYDPEFQPTSVLPQLAEIFTSHSHRRVGTPETIQQFVFVYPLRRGSTRAHLAVEMSKEGLQWKVYDYGYGVDDEATNA